MVQIPSRILGAFASVGLVFVLILASVVGVMAYQQVDEGFVGVQREWGAVTGTVYSPGPHWVVPVAQNVQPVEIRPRTYTMSDASGEGNEPARQDAIEVTTINGTTVRVDVTVRYRVNPERAAAFVSEWGDIQQVEDRLIRPSVRSRIRDEGSGIKSSDIYQQAGRQRLANAAREELRGEFADEALVLEVVQVRNVHLPADYQTALNRKEIAKQRVLEKQYEVQQEREESERKRVEAQADADVIRIRGEALRENRVVLTQRYIEAIDETDKIILATGEDGTPVIIDTGESSGTSGSANASG